MVIAFPPKLENDAQGYNWLARSAYLMDIARNEKIVFRGPLNWFDGQMCAPFGALLNQAQQRSCSIGFEGVSGPVEGRWMKNGFSAHFGGVSMKDVFDTSLPYVRFDRKRSVEFNEYLFRQLLWREHELPEMSPSSKDRFASSVQELYDNASDHSGNSPAVYCCGQIYPTLNVIGLCVTDLGIGFQKSVARRVPQIGGALQAIDWAMKRGHTTKEGPIPGGLGLHWLNEFVAQNKGRLQVVSGTAFWEFDGQKVLHEKLIHYFPGSIVTLIVNQIDATIYGDDDIDADDLF